MNQLVLLIIAFLACNAMGQHTFDESPTTTEAAASTWFTEHSDTESVNGVECAVPGVHFPNYTTPPVTNFTCSDKEFIPGYYADMETGCQVARICTQTRMASMLCPSNTIFNQSTLLCDTWFKTNCSDTPMYYSANSIFLSTDDFGPPSYTGMFTDESREFMTHVRKFALSAVLEKVENAKRATF